MALYQNTCKYAKEWKLFNYMFFFNVAEEPNLPFFKRHWALKETDDIIRRFLFGLHRISRNEITFYSFYLGPFVLSWGKIKK